MSTTEPGLRELKKQLTRETIADAALRLTLKKGLERVTIEEIAHEAFVSPRTVSNYFSGKEEAVVTAGSQEWSALVLDLANRPAEEPQLQALCEVVTEFARTRSRKQLDLLVQKAELVARYPTLHPFQIAKYDEVEAELREAVAERTGSDPEQDMYPYLVAAAAVAAIRAAIRLWARSGAKSGDLVTLLQTAFATFDQGLPQPEGSTEDEK